MYSRDIDGQVYTFGVSGKLIRNVMVMFDRETQTLWSQLLGKAVRGELVGTELEFVPYWLTTWQEWHMREPETLALIKGHQGSADPYQSYYESPQAGVLGEAFSDDRLYTKQYVIGVAQGDEAMAYPWLTLNDEPVVNDVVGGTPVLIVFNADSATGVVFDRRLNGQTLTFHLADLGVPTLTDAETGSTWDGLGGQALDGPLGGTQLARVKSTAAFWFGWKDSYPETQVYGLEE